MLVVGNPAKQIGWMSAFGERLHFAADNFAVCTASNEKYRLENGLVNRI